MRRFAHPVFAEVEMLRFGSAAEAERWLAGLPERRNRDRF
jgi:hypothetical protein